MLTRQSDGSKDGSENCGQLDRIMELDSYDKSSDQFISTPKSIKHKFEDNEKDDIVKGKGDQNTAGKTDDSSGMKNYHDFSSFKEVKVKPESIDCSSERQSEV